MNTKGALQRLPKAQRLLNQRHVSERGTFAYHGRRPLPSAVCSGLEGDVIVVHLKAAAGEQAAGVEIVQVVDLKLLRLLLERPEGSRRKQSGPVEVEGASWHADRDQAKQAASLTLNDYNVVWLAPQPHTIPHT